LHVQGILTKPSFTENLYAELCPQDRLRTPRAAAAARTLRVRVAPPPCSDAGRLRMPGGHAPLLHESRSIFKFWRGSGGLTQCIHVPSYCARRASPVLHAAWVCRGLVETPLPIPNLPNPSDVAIRTGLHAPAFRGLDDFTHWHGRQR
jgi:hypothetical protein